MGYSLGVDLGTTYTAAAIAGVDGVRIVQLQHDRYAVPSVVVPADDGAQVAIGRDAQRISALDPTRAAREFKRRFGDDVPMLVGGQPWMPEQLTALLLEQVYSRVVDELGSDPDRLVLTHPATWGDHRLNLLTDVVGASVGQPVELVAEPVAAAIHFHDRCQAEQRAIPPAARIAVYDLGGGTFDTALLGLKDGGYEILGEPEGLGYLGGLDFDQAVFDLVTERAADLIGQVDPTDAIDRAALTRLREECTLAKETLSVADRVEIPVALNAGSQLVVIERSEFEARIEPMVDQTADLIERTINSAGDEAVDAVLLVGGSSRVPLILRTLSERLGLQVRVDSHPKQAIALGAALSTAPIGVIEQKHQANVATGPITPLTAELAVTEVEPSLPVEFTIEASRLLSDVRQRYLVALNGSAAGSSHDVTAEWTSIGRGNASDFALGDRAVSGRHAEVRLVDEVVEFRDLESTNGSWLDGNKVVSAELRAGSIIELGTTLLLVEAPLESVHNPSQLAASWKPTEPFELERRRRGIFAKKPDHKYSDLLIQQREALDAVVADTRAARRLTDPSGPRLRAFSVHAPERAHEESVESPRYGSVTLGYGPRPSLLGFRTVSRLRAAERAALNEFAEPYRFDPWIPVSVRLLGNETTISLEYDQARLLARSVIHDFVLRHPEEQVVVLGIDLTRNEWSDVAALGVTQGVDGRAQQPGLLISIEHARAAQVSLSDQGREQGSAGTLRLLPPQSGIASGELTFTTGEDAALSGRIEGIPIKFIPAGLGPVALV